MVRCSPGVYEQEPLERAGDVNMINVNILTEHEESLTDETVQMTPERFIKILQNDKYEFWVKYDSDTDTLLIR